MKRFPPVGLSTLGGSEALAAAIASGAEIERLLEEIRRLMGADESTLLVLDVGRTMLENVASRGLDRTPRGTARVPVGRGFAGRVALTRAPVVLEDIEQSEVLNPVLRQHGVRSLLGVPVIARGRLIGVLHVGSVTPRTFADEEIGELEGAAAHLAEALQAQLPGEEHNAALVLQRSLVPTAPIAVPGLDMAGRYVPAEGDLGGDWYDVFQLPSGAVGLVMGDVVGHGLHAAVIMGRLRSSLRSYALETTDPAEVLRRLDRKICHFERGALATVLYGVLLPPFDHITFSCAGHLPPLIARSGSLAEPVSLPHDVLLGVDPGTARHGTTVALPADASVCLYTDGLVERRSVIDTDAPDQLAQMDTLRRSFTGGDDAETACTRILHDTIGDEVAEDDIALLVIRRAPAT